MLLVFDAVGTLIRPLQRVAETYFEFGQKHGSRFNRDQIKIRFATLFQQYFRSGTATSEAIEKQNWQALVTELFDDVNDVSGLFDELWNYFAQPDHWCLFADVELFWPALKLAKLELAIASNFDQRLRKILAALSPLDSIEDIYISSEIGFPKPRAEFFEYVEANSPSANDWVMIGDDPVCDTAAARERGWQAILIDRNHSFQKASAICSLTELDLSSFANQGKSKTIP